MFESFNRQQRNSESFCLWLIITRSETLCTYVNINKTHLLEKLNIFIIPFIKNHCSTSWLLICWLILSSIFIFFFIFKWSLFILRSILIKHWNHQSFAKIIYLFISFLKLFLNDKIILTKYFTKYFSNVIINWIWIKIINRVIKLNPFKD